MGVRPIRTEADYEATLAEIDRLWGARPGTTEGDLLDVLAILVEHWEELHYPIPRPDPIEAIQFCLDRQGLDAKSLVGVIGSRSRVFEIMNRKRNLTLPMIRALHERFGVPLEVLIQPNHTAQKAG